MKKVDQVAVKNFINFPPSELEEKLRQPNNQIYYNKNNLNIEFFEKIKIDNMFDLNLYEEKKISLLKKLNRILEKKSNKKLQEKNNNTKESDLNEEETQINSKYKKLRAGKYRCLKYNCHRVFKNYEEYEKHSKKNVCIEFHVCNFCNKKYLRLESLNRHIKSIHYQKDYNCDICKKILKNYYCKIKYFI
jgi:hypothetical protein